MQNVFLEKSGMRAKILSRGASLASLYLDGHKDSLVLELADFASDDQHFGAIAGPVAGRIRGGSCVIAGARHEFERNENGRTTLHGGSGGLGRQIWQIEAQAEDFVELVLEQPDGKLGFPGNRRFTCRYQLEEGGVLRLELGAVSDAESVCNLAFHPYFCLDDRPDFADHSLQILADSYLPVDADNLPTGEVLPVAGTELDFRQARSLADIAGGRAAAVDIPFCLAEKQRPCQPVARLTSARSGIAMEISTDQPGLQFYTGTHIPAGLRSANGRQLGPFAGLCLEPQAWPDAPNQPHFPSIRLTPDQPYHQLSELRFSCR
jgi:aldose 1-epimerase